MSNQDTQVAIAELQEFITLCPNAREARKALAVKQFSLLYPKSPGCGLVELHEHR